MDDTKMAEKIGPRVRPSINTGPSAQVSRHFCDEEACEMMNCSTWKSSKSKNGRNRTVLPTQAAISAHRSTLQHAKITEIYKWHIFSRANATYASVDTTCMSRHTTCMSVNVVHTSATAVCMSMNAACTGRAPPPPSRSPPRTSPSETAKTERG